MRIDRLDLERYGHFEGTSLDLSDGKARLHIVHGHNEAGKSTTLQAICDLLFGVPERSRLGFRHGNSALRIGAALRLPDGRVLEVKRRKGRTATLLDGDGVALPDTVLAPLLGGIDRAAFERLFGLDHERLRAGGEAMLQAGGDLARTLFQAGSGLSDLNDRLSRLARDADEIGSPHRRQAGKPLWQAIDAQAAAAARMRSEATKAEAWEAAEGAVTTAQAQLAAIRAALAEAQRTRSRLERQRRVRPLLARLDEQARLLAAEGEGPDLPDDLADQWRRAETHLMTASRQAERAREEAGAATEALERAGEVPALLSLAARIEALYQRQGEIAKARADLPRRRQERDITAARLEQAARDIGLDTDDAARLSQRQPDRRLVARIRDHIRAHARLDQALADAHRRADAAATAARQADRQPVPDAPDPRDLARAEAALAAAQRPGAVELHLDRAERALAEGEARIARMLSRLGRFQGTAAQLAALPLPAMDAVETQRQQETALENRRQRLEADARAIAEEGQRLRRSLRELAEGGEVPTPAAIADARRHRDRLWAGLRPHLDGPTTAPADAVPGFEQALHGADRLVDLREREAARVASYIRAESDLAALMEREAALAREQAALEAQGTEMAARWQALWGPAGVGRPGAPAEMAAFLTQADAVIAAHAQQAEQRETLAALAAQAGQCMDELRQALALCGVAIPGDQPLARLRGEAEAAVATARQALEAATRVAQERQRARDALEAARAESTQAEAAIDAWRQAWSADMDAIGLPADAGPAEAEAALRGWEDIGSELRHLADLDHRIAALERDIGGHGAEGAALAAAAAAFSPGLDLDVAADAVPRALFAALAAAREQAARRDLLAERQARAAEALEAALLAERRAGEALADLRCLYRLAEGADVPALVAAAARRRALVAQGAALRTELAQAGDGHDPEQLRVEADAADPDALAADAAARTAEIERLQGELADMSARLRDAERGLDEMRGRAGIGGAAQDAADAAARAAELAGRWLRLRAAALLLTQAVERYRDRNEHPLLRRAGTILAAMAVGGGNPVTRLKVDYGDADHPVLVGVRRDGADAQVEDMSEGLRDQLFLALRIAAVEAHVARATPLPFIADDLFITSDERRTRAGLLALAELGGVTQVVLFTHHHYVVDAGLEALGDGVRIHRLG
ncbi:AAA family ATPase [Niveispirillum fermenti]|uniref:AAA family ATPase n=1 Tax=Niveispirillum fermenti TaxID=1233113 RepID=UPI003A8812C4